MSGHKEFEKAFLEFKSRQKKDDESDGEFLPIEQRLDNAFLAGWQAAKKSDD